ncbi:MAG: hypothetical protein ABSG53_33410, partial [Thermoguttaceae bacterium]
MQRRLFAAATVLWFVALAMLAVPAVAQQPPTFSLAFSERSIQIDSYLQHGQQLEVQRRWGEALAHYEEGLRQFPDENALEKRFELARLHYDLGRRYADRSFAEHVSQMPAEKALELYLQVLLKIETHYVEQPAWKDLVDRGTSDLETALGERVFLERNLPSRNVAAVDAFRRELRQTLAQRSVANRMEARDST